MLELKGVSHTFQKGTVNERKALDHVDLSLEDGEFAVIVGSNGAGKSTLLSAVAGQFVPDEGEILLDQEDITFVPDYRRSRYVGRLYQDPAAGTAPHMSVEENLAVAYLHACRGKHAFSRITEKDRAYFREKLSSLGMGLEERMQMQVGLLSGGQRQALALLMATMVTPKVLLLDEHTAALDPLASRTIMDRTEKIVREQKMTCLMVTHDLHLALTAGTRTLMMDAGRIVLDVGEKERRSLRVEDLLERFARSTGTRMEEDRVLLSGR